MHGSTLRNYCLECGEFYDETIISESETTEDKLPHCKKCGGLIKPDVVLYEEQLDEEIINRSIAAIMTCDVLIVVGTSLTVYPAAGFIRYFKGNYIVLINKQQTAYDNQCDLVFNEDVCEVIKKL